MEVAGGVRAVREGLHRPRRLCLQRPAHLPGGRYVRRPVVPVHHGLGHQRPYAGGHPGHRLQPDRHHAHPVHRPEQGHQDGEAHHHGAGPEQDRGTEEGRPRRVRHRHHPLRPRHLRQGRQGFAQGIAEPERADVHGDVPGDEHRAHRAGAGDQCVPVPEHRPEAQLRPAAVGLPAGAGADVLPAAGAEPHRDTAGPHHQLHRHLHPVHHAGAVPGPEGVPLLRPERTLQQPYHGR